MYFLPPGIKENPQRRWALPDRIFFGFGACHILAGVYLLDFPAAGFRAHWVRPGAGYTGNHIFVSRGEVAFDFHGYTCVERLLTHHCEGWSARFPGWNATVEVVAFDLLNTAELNARGMRGPDQYLHDPIPRARRFLQRYRPRGDSSQTLSPGIITIE